MGSLQAKILALSAALLAAVGTFPAGAEAQGTPCTFGFDLILDPGLSMEPSTGTHRTDGLGTIDCQGPVNGWQPSGVGRLGEDGPYGTADPDSCMSGGEATGTDHLAIQTANGLQQITSEYRAVYGKLSNENWVFGGEFTGTRFTGSFRFTLLEGDCVTSPVTKIRVTGKGLIHD